ncbi:MAG TPA: type IV toxin-antitoxin system AbiEi family antitoxin domain-containing protein [Microlunatus sp.]|nr:type IV toxin-antitoxin system AbiEi family antitoxin domain-containing protein [Microlunatus sp.]
MHARHDPSDRLLDLAAAQSGVIDASQLTALGFPLRSAERLVTQRHWRRLATGIYHVGPTPAPWLGLAWAGILLGGPASRLGFEAAGHLWGILPDEPQQLTVLVPVGRGIVDRGPWTFRRETAGTRDSRSPGSPSRTTIEDTVVDLSGVASQAGVLELVTTAVQSRRTTAARILACVERRPRVKHRRYLGELLSDVADGAQSALELRYLSDVERAHGLPRAARQVRARRGKAYRDVRYDAYATVVELDGEIHRAQKLRDARRDNAALLDGDVTLRYGWPDVSERPCWVAWEVAAILVARGWGGLPVRCPRCRHAR